MRKKLLAYRNILFKTITTYEQKSLWTSFDEGSLWVIFKEKHRVLQAFGVGEEDKQIRPERERHLIWARQVRLFWYASNVILGVVYMILMTSFGNS